MSLATRIFLCLLFATFSNLLIAQTTIYRPSSYTGTYNNPANAEDGISSTYSYANVTGQLGDIQGAEEKWRGFSAATGTPTSVKLKITNLVMGAAPCRALLAYSTDGGGTEHYIYSGVANRSEQTDDITLSNSQDLTKVVVDGEVDCDLGDRAGVQQNIYEIWIEVTE